MRINTYNTQLDEEKKNILVKEKSMNYPLKDIICMPKDVVNLMNTCFELNRRAEEYVYIIGMAQRGKVLGVFELSHGSSNASWAAPREIFIRLLLCGANYFFIVHNHPSGDATPSRDDNQTTARIKECADLLGVNLLDHIIIGDNCYYSYKEMGKFKEEA